MSKDIIYKYFSEIGIKSQKVELALVGDFRLDATYYSNSDSIIHKIPTEPLSAFCEDIFMGPIFKRDEVLNEKYGVRFFASNEIVSLDPSETFITNQQAESLNLLIKKGMILITGYGTIGSLRIVDSIIEGYAVADNVTRIVPLENMGYIACFLSSKYGQQLLNDYSSGSAVKFIQAASIAKIPVPLLSETIVNATNQNYLKAVSCREEAYELLEKGKQLVYQYNNLPLLAESSYETIDTSFDVVTRFVSSSEFTDEFRLDAHYYNPIAKKAFDNIQYFTQNSSLLSELTSDIIIGKRFKRNYVQSDFGTPFLSGKNIVQIRPTDLKYLSDTEISFIDELLVKQNWTLITCSGTLGRTCFVYNNFENYAASQHILRVVPNDKLIDPAYLYCFLSIDYGYYQVVRNKYGSVIDEIDDKSIENILVPVPNIKQQEEIGNLIRRSYELRAEAINLEDQAQSILAKELIGL
jgi:type I restriction enzyme S subunit